MTLQEEDRGRLVDVLGYGKRIERNFSGTAACHRRQFGLAQLYRGDGSSFAIGGRFDEIGHCLTPCCSTTRTIQSSMLGRLDAGWLAYRDPGHVQNRPRSQIQIRPVWVKIGQCPPANRNK